MPETDHAAARAAADARRDRRDYPDAAALYATHLREHPADRDGWIGYGDCMVALGDPGAALLLWRTAERLAPPEPALLQRLGDALAALGRTEEACAAWARVLTADPTQAAAREALLAAEPLAALRARAGQPPPSQAAGGQGRTKPGAPGPLPPLLFDLSDLLEYWATGNRAPTGIQRVQLEVLRAMLDRGAPTIGLVAFDRDGDGWRALPAARLRDLADLAEAGTDPHEPSWTLGLAAAREALRPAPLPEQATLVNLGTSWWLADYMRRVLDAKRRHGLRYVPLLYDCIPLLRPEHCAAGLVDEFARWFAGLCFTADAVLCISQATAADFRTLRARVAPGVDAPITVVPLDAAPRRAGAAAAGVPVAARPYVLCVGTIESRKNHLLLFNAWLVLLRRHGADAIPDLVCVGKRGWLAEAALALHAHAPALQDRVRLRHQVADAELASLYAGCLFTVQASHHEGWGLPVTESLGHGKVALVPDHSAYRESGAGGALYFAPGNEPDLIAKLESLIFDAGAREAAEHRLRRGVRLRNWTAVADDILAATAAVEPLEPAPAIPFALGQPVALRLLPGPEPLPGMASVDALRDGDGWHSLEPWGVWTRPGLARLQLPLGLGVAEPLRLHLALRGPPAPLRLGVQAGEDGWRRADLPAEASAHLTVDIPPAAAGALRVTFDSGEGAVLGEGRRVGVGLVAVMLCRRDDLLARLEWLEGIAVPRLTRL